MKREPTKTTTFIAILLAITLLQITAFANPTFKGSLEFENEKAELKITLDQARNALDAFLKKHNKTLRAFPEEVILIHDGGYLFVEGDFKNHIPLKGYHVSENGLVIWLNLEKSIPVKEYMKLIKRDGWGSWIYDN